MSNFIESFGFHSHPFEKYVAENEPDIQTYAVTPPYFEETKKRTASISSFILFGFRGSGKSATRITNEKNSWKEIDSEKSHPLIVNFTDFEPIISNNKIEDVSSNIIISYVAFLTIESILLWISNNSLPAENYIDVIDNLPDEKKKNFVNLVKSHYLTRPDFQRKLSISKTMKTLNQTWYNKTTYWIEKKWDPISSIISDLASKASSNYLDLDISSKKLHELLHKEKDYNIGISVIDNLVSTAKDFGFSGICVYVDKVDETTKTGNSSALSAKLVYPILSQVQLMEIPGFSWVFFLWDKIKSELSEEQMRVRLDKYAFSEISWEENYLKYMINERLKHFSRNKISSGQELCDPSVNFDIQISKLIHMVSKSPRELVRMFDVLVREYDVKYSNNKDLHYLNDKDFQDTISSYVKNVVWTLYDKKNLSEILRFGKERFLNKDVQAFFKMSDQGARNRIRNWVTCGAVRQSGTNVGENDAGGKPANVYTIADPRILFMLENKLFDSESLIVEADI